MNKKSKAIDPKWFTAKFIEEVDPIITKGSNRNYKRRMVKLQCIECGKEFIVDLSNAKRIKQAYCSKKCSAKKNRGIEIGNENHPLYSRWLSMNQRIKNKNSCNYKNYGSRGIKIHPTFATFKGYHDYVTKLPGYNEFQLDVLSLDRIDNDGNYEPGNLRWVDKTTQILNQRKRKATNTYTGVSLNTQKTKWVARLTYKGKCYNIGTFNTEKEALEARNKFILKHKFPHKIQMYK